MVLHDITDIKNIHEAFLVKQLQGHDFVISCIEQQHSQFRRRLFRHWTPVTSYLSAMNEHGRDSGAIWNNNAT